MNLIIKGMKMPKSCDSCDLIQFSDEGLEAHCPLLPYYRWCGTPPDYRPEGCPLVEIPTPHGRLIDADEIKEYAEWHCQRFIDGDHAEVGLTVNQINSFVRNAPTIIEAEVSE